MRTRRLTPSPSPTKEPSQPQLQTLHPLRPTLPYPSLSCPILPYPKPLPLPLLEDVEHPVGVAISAEKCSPRKNGCFAERRRQLQRNDDQEIYVVCFYREFQRGLLDFFIDVHSSSLFNEGFRNVLKRCEGVLNETLTFNLPSGVLLFCSRGRFF